MVDKLPTQKYVQAYIKAALEKGCSRRQSIPRLLNGYRCIPITNHIGCFAGTGNATSRVDMECECTEMGTTG